MTFVPQDWRRPSALRVGLDDEATAGRVELWLHLGDAPADRDDPAGYRPEEANVTAVPKSRQRFGRGRTVAAAAVGSSGQEWRG
jgi:hypothetical protein